jgi:hypothetical protein
MVEFSRTAQPFRSRIVTRASMASAAATLIALAAPQPAAADDLGDLRNEMQQMRQQYEGELQRLQRDYEARLKKVEDRLKAAEKATAAASAKAEAAEKSAAAQPAPAIAAQEPSPAPEPAPAPAVAAQEPVPAPAPGPQPAAGPAPSPAAGGVPASANAFNPAIGAVLDGKFASESRNPNDYRIPGFALGDSAKPPPRGFAIDESEVNLSANVDQALYGNLTLAFERDNTVGVEEAFIQPSSLPYGFTLKAGRFFSGIGYLNEQHAHTWDFADQALPYRAFLNTQYDDDGVQLRWLAPTARFLEFGGELFRGDSFPAGGEDNHNRGVGAWSAFVHMGDDIGESASYRVGLSQLWTSAKDRTTTGLAGTDTFSGTDHTYIADATYKWAPGGNFVERYLKLQGEFFLRQEQGVFNGTSFSDATQTGFYAQGVYQFMPQWRVGLRYDQVHASSLGPGFGGTTLDNLGATPRRYTAMIDYTTSEFGRFRLQYDLDQSRPQTDNEFILQYTVSLGAHGAHQY